jgi:hypothetical protein
MDLKAGSCRQCYTDCRVGRHRKVVFLAGCRRREQNRRQYISLPEVVPALGARADLRTDVLVRSAVSHRAL